MKRWMTLVGLAGVVAGIPVGVALNQSLREPLIEDSPWLQRFKAVFQLSATQLHQIRRVLAVQEREILDVYVRLGHNIPPELSGKIKSIKRRADERIQAVLDTDQLDRYRKARQTADSTDK